MIVILIMGVCLIISGVYMLFEAYRSFKKYETQNKNMSEQDMILYGIMTFVSILVIVVGTGVTAMSILNWR